jgi:cytochrome P450
VLDDHQRFHVPYAAKMEAITGPFILGLDGGPLYDHDHAALRAAVRADDLPGLGQSALGSARARMEAASDGTIDAVAELADPNLDHLIRTYFGAPGPDTATQLRWARSLFEEIFINVRDVASIRERALSDAGEMRANIDSLVAARADALDAGAPAPDDVLTRLLRAGADGDGLHHVPLRHNLIGLIVGWIPTASKAFALAVEELLERPTELAAAQRAAREEDQETVSAYLFEALRFRPQNWGLLRDCPTETTLATGTPRETEIAAGTVVVVATQSAMYDERVVPSPEEFRPGRPWDQYMHFGHGLHTCFGEAINRVQLPALLQALLERGPLRREGELRWDGPYPSHLPVGFSQA